MNESFSQIEASGMPALFYAADGAAIEQQKKYLQLFKWILVLSFAGVLAGAIAPVLPSSWTTPLRIISGFVLVGSAFLTGVMKTAQHEKSWYGARAVAESVKTLAWKYAMGAEPYPKTGNEKDTDRIFAEDLRTLLKDRDTLSFAYAGEINAAPQITSTMIALRESSWKDRLAVYEDQRIADQRKWYANKAKSSSSSEGLLFNLILMAQGLAFIFAFILVAYPSFSLDLPALFATLSASVLAWLQVKRFQETSQSYGVAAHEVGTISTQARHVKDDSSLAAFVKDAESAFSREHTMWVARREERQV
jgi:hypothetical protein